MSSCFIFILFYVKCLTCNYRDCSPIVLSSPFLSCLLFTSLYATSVSSSLDSLAQGI